MFFAFGSTAVFQLPSKALVKKWHEHGQYLYFMTSWSKGKGKGKFYPRTGHESPEGEQRYRSTLSLTSALDGVGGQRHVPAALPPGKDPVPIL